MSEPTTLDDLHRHLRRELVDARQRYHDATDDVERSYWRGASVGIAAAADLLDADREPEPELVRCSSCGSPLHEGASCGLCRYDSLPEAPAD